MSQKSKILSGVWWVSLSTIIMKGFNFIIFIFLARLLAPSDFGLVAMALIIINFFEMFRDLGIGAALIHKKEDQNAAADTVFFLLPTIAVFFYLVSYFFAPIIADFFNEEKLELIIRVLSLAFVIWSYGSLPRILLAKDLKFKTMVIPGILSKIGFGAVAILMAFWGYGVWSLVGGRIVLELLSVFTFWHVCKWRPSMRFNKKIALELLSYGKHVITADITLFIISVADIIFIGRILGSDSLGYYSIALSIAGFFTIQVSMLLSEVIFPAYSDIREDIHKLGWAYLKTLKYLSIIAVPATFGLIAISWYFIKVVYGDKWLPAVSVLQILCIYGLNRSLLKTTENLYLAAGKPKIITKINLFQVFLMLILLYPLTTYYGILGTSIAVTIPSIFILLFTLNEAGKITGNSFYLIIKTLLPATAGSVIMFLLVMILQKMIVHHSPVLILLFSIIAGFISYGVFMCLTQKEELKEIRQLIIK